MHRLPIHEKYSINDDDYSQSKLVTASLKMNFRYSQPTVPSWNSLTPLFHLGRAHFNLHLLLYLRSRRNWCFSESVVKSGEALMQLVVQLCGTSWYIDERKSQVQANLVAILKIRLTCWVIGKKISPPTLKLTAAPRSTNADVTIAHSVGYNTPQ